MKIDSITLEILNTKVAAASEEMALTLKRTGRSLYVKEAIDFAVGLVDLKGKFYATPRDFGSALIDYDCMPTISGALSYGAPQDMPAPSGGAMVPVVLAEYDKRTNKRNVLVLNSIIVGSGARYGSDGYDGVDGSISTIRNTPAEKSELEAGVDIIEYGLNPDSAGPGQWRGGLGLKFTFRVTQGGSQLAEDRGVGKEALEWARQPAHDCVNEVIGDRRRGLGEVVDELARFRGLQDAQARQIQASDPSVAPAQ